ncbi:MAG: hypothetical protein LUB61_04160 [Eggerthellaceae bacterium]|nr:hypothetical protein [Eggerthellaceae bacterium]
MRHIDDKLSRAAHIRGFTAGTSNEISFSVLDAAKRDLEVEDVKKKKQTKRRPATIPMPGNARQSGKKPDKYDMMTPLFTLGSSKRPPYTPKRDSEIILSEGTAVAAPAPAIWQTPFDEVARRKSSRRRRRFLFVGVTCVIILLLGLGAATMLMSLLNVQNTLQSNLGALLESIESTDDVLIPFDDLVGQQIAQDIGTPEEIRQRIDDYESMSASLEEANKVLGNDKSSVDYLGEKLIIPNDQYLANQAAITAVARSQMIETGSELLSLTLPLFRARAQVDYAWDVLKQADDLAAQAAAGVADSNEESISASREQSVTARDLFAEVYDNLTEVQGYDSSIDFGAYLEYLQLRMDAQDAAIAADDAYLAHDRATMNEQNDIYNDLDMQASQLGVSLDDNPVKLYDELIQQDVDLYEVEYLSSRAQASNADAILRDYLGASDK